MTIILGVKCIDGIVLVGDRKLTDSNKTDFSYGDKITGEVEGFLTAFSGDKSVFDLFRIKLRECTIMEQPITRADTMILIIHKIMAELYKAFYKYEFDVLLAISGSKYQDGISRLYYFFPDGRIEEIDNEKPYKCIGSGKTHSKIFLNKIWKNDMKMEETAQLGYFIVKYIVKFGLDDSIGIGSNPPFHVPQIHYLPNNQNDIRIDDKTLERFDLIINEKLEKFEKNLVNVLM